MASPLDLLAPPLKFGTVEHEVYRPLREIMQFMSDAGIKMVHLGLKSWTLSQKAKEGSDEPLLREELIKEAIEMVLDQQNHPLVLMCQSGVQETGLVVGCLRRLQGWCMTSCLSEYRMYAEGKSRTSSEQLIESFDTDLVALQPQHLPTWMLRHEEGDAVADLAAEIEATLGPLDDVAGPEGASNAAEN
eukprot:gene10838-16474_t